MNESQTMLHRNNILIVWFTLCECCIISVIVNPLFSTHKYRNVKIFTWRNKTAFKKIYNSYIEMHCMLKNK